MAIIKRIYYIHKQYKQLMFRRLFASVAMLSVLLINPAAAATLAVVYPDLPPPYQQIFDQIIEGIETRHQGELIKYPIDKPVDPATLLDKMNSDGVNRVITLGRRGYAYNNELKGKYPYVTGALPIKPNSVSGGVSLIADPANLFEQLKTLSPSTRQIYVVYTQKSEWLIEKAEQAAKEHELKLIASEVTNLSEAVEHYQRILKQADSQTDAIWLPLDAVTANENVILPLLLRESWDRNIVVFSSKPGHVRRGFLFTLFPDNIQDGARLAEMVEMMAENEQAPKVELSRTRKVGVNLRTASHLGLEYSKQMKSTFYQTFPQSGF